MLVIYILIFINNSLTAETFSLFSNVENFKQNCTIAQLTKVLPKNLLNTFFSHFFLTYYLITFLTYYFSNAYQTYQ